MSSIACPIWASADTDNERRVNSEARLRRPMDVVLRSTKCERRPHHDPFWSSVQTISNGKQGEGLTPGWDTFRLELPKLEVST